MDKDIVISSSPHVSAGNSTRRIMTDVIIALMPSVIAATVIFGYLALVNCIVCAAACFGFETLYEILFNNKKKRDVSSFDLSCIVTGLILALNLPTVMDVWGLNIKHNGNIVFSFDSVILCILGSLVAICLVKMLFGGIGKNFANPAVVGRIFLFLAFSSAFKAIVTTDSWGIVETGATWLGQKLPVSGDNLLDMFLGKVGSAAVGETCVIAILIGYVYLAVRKVIDWRIPLIICVSAFVFCVLLDGIVAPRINDGVKSFQFEALMKKGLAHLLSGGLIFGAVFMATDYSTSPNTFKGGVIFAVGIGLITAVIRAFGSYPEGMSFAILIMNILTPIIDKYVRPRPFGFVKPAKDKKKNKTSENKTAEVK